MKSMLIFLGLTILAGVGYVFGHIAFMNYPQADNGFSIIWTVLIGVLLYQLLRYMWKPSTAATPAERRREVYRFVLSLCEVVSFASLIFLAILFSSVSTMPGNEHFLSMIIAWGVLMLGLLVGLRTIRMVTSRRFLTQAN